MEEGKNSSEEPREELSRLRKRIAELEASEKKRRQIVDNANSIILCMDNKGNITFFNAFAQRFFGYYEKEIIGKNVIGTIVPKTDEAGSDLARMIEDIAQNPERYSINENENMRHNGERVRVLWTNKAVIDESGLISEIICIGNDITNRPAH